MLLREIGVPAKFDTLIKVLDEFVVEFDARHERDQPEGRDAHDDEYLAVMRGDKVREHRQCVQCLVTVTSFRDIHRQ